MRKVVVKFYFTFHHWFKKILDRVRDSRFLGIMIDESTYIFVIGHLIFFANFIEEDFTLCIFLGLLHIEERKKDACIIFETLTRNMND